MARRLQSIIDSPDGDEPGKPRRRIADFSPTQQRASRHSAVRRSGPRRRAGRPGPRRGAGRRSRRPFRGGPVFRSTTPSRGQPRAMEGCPAATPGAGPQRSRRSGGPFSPSSRAKPSWPRASLTSGSPPWLSTARPPSSTWPAIISRHPDSSHRSYSTATSCSPPSVISRTSSRSSVRSTAQRGWTSTQAWPPVSRHAVTADTRAPPGRFLLGRRRWGRSGSNEHSNGRAGQAGCRVRGASPPRRRERLR